MNGELTIFLGRNSTYGHSGMAYLVTGIQGMQPGELQQQKAKALATLEDENGKRVSVKWKNPDGSLVDFCGIRRKR